MSHVDLMEMPRDRGMVPTREFESLFSAPLRSDINSQFQSPTRYAGAVAPLERLVTRIPGPAAVVIEVESEVSGVPDAYLIPGTATDSTNMNSGSLSSVVLQADISPHHHLPVTGVSVIKPKGPKEVSPPLHPPSPVESRYQYR